MKMYEITVNNQFVAVATEEVVKLFMNALIGALPPEISVAAHERKDLEVETPAPAPVQEAPVTK